jgi:hypothetical protein
VAQLREQPAIVGMLIELIEEVATHANPEVDENSEKHFEDSAAWGSPATPHRGRRSGNASIARGHRYLRSPATLDRATTK